MDIYGDIDMTDKDRRCKFCGDALDDEWCYSCKTGFFWNEDGSYGYRIYCGEFCCSFWWIGTVEEFFITSDSNRIGNYLGALFRLDFCPDNLTPQNITEEKIRRWILMS